MSYQYAEMSQAQIEEFLHVPRHAVVATSRKNGAPQVTPVWYLYEDGVIYISISANSAKYRNLQRDARIGICVAGAHPNARAVIIYGMVELIVDDSAWRDDIHWRLVRRYHDSDEEAQTFMDSMPTDDLRALAVVTPDKVIAEDYN